MAKSNNKKAPLMLKNWPIPSSLIISLIEKPATRQTKVIKRGKPITEYRMLDRAVFCANAETKVSAVA